MVTDRHTQIQTTTAHAPPAVNGTWGQKKYKFTQTVLLHNDLHLKERWPNTTAAS